MPLLVSVVLIRLDMLLRLPNLVLEVLILLLKICNETYTSDELLSSPIGSVCHAHGKLTKVKNCIEASNSYVD